MRAFAQVDVFGNHGFDGNALAVVLDGRGLRDADMQAFARWTNLAETTFVLPAADPRADYRVRIFTPQQELPFAGHPTLGTCHAWLRAGGTSRRASVIVQECGAGLVPIARHGEELAFAAPPLIRGGPVEPELLHRLLGQLGITAADVVDSRWVDNGPGWVGLLLANSDAVLALRPVAVEQDLGVIGRHRGDGDWDFEVRAFVPPSDEDPVTGSLNASLAQWLLETGRASAPYVVRQGTAVGADGRVRVCTDADGGVWVGGQTRVRIEGEVDL